VLPPLPYTPPSPPSVVNTTTPHNTNNTITTGSNTSTNNMDGKDPEDNFILSQSDVAPRPSNPSITSSKHIQSSFGIITTLLEEQRAARTEDIQLQTIMTPPQTQARHHQDCHAHHGEL
jgi:hypothetical protein